MDLAINYGLFFAFSFANNLPSLSYRITQRRLGLNNINSITL